MATVQPRRVSEAFLDEASEKILAGESVVLLGPRYCGKAYFISKLFERLGQDKVGRVLPPLELYRREFVTHEDELRRLILEALGRIGLAPPDECGGDMFAPLDRLPDLADQPCALFVANVDQMAHPLARRFLEGVQTRVQEGKLIAVLSGELDLRDLVHGPKSEFRSANVYLVQGFAEDHFQHLVQRYANELTIRFEDSVEACRVLLEQTGSNLFLLRMVFWAIVEQRMRGRVPRDQPISCDRFQNRSGDKQGMLGRTYEALVLYHARGVVASDPHCWPQLEGLLEGRPVRVPAVEDALEPLELAGVAIRERGFLRFSSPLMEMACKRYYNRRRLGDLYASRGWWEKAFGHYRQLTPAERLGPVGTESWAEVEGTVQALGLALHRAAASGPHEVKKLFAQGCSSLLGLTEVAFWLEKPGGWSAQTLEGFTTIREVADKLDKDLPRDLSPGPLPVRETWKPYALAALLPTVRSDRRELALVGHLETPWVLARDREALARKLLEEFRLAYTHAIDVKRAQLRLEIRNKHLEIVNSIFGALGTSVINAREALVMAARGLRLLDYRRVLFCLVDPERKWIDGVLDDSDDPSVQVDQMTHFSLDEPTADLQPYVIHTRQPRVIEDAALEPLANKTVVRKARMKAEALVPILNQDGEAIGTIHIEREDGDVPSQDEVEDLMTFGRQLAVAIEQSERVNLLQSALDKVPDPVVIVDSGERVRYANQPATDLLDVRSGWHSRDSAQPLGGDGTTEVGKDLRASLNSDPSQGGRIVRRVSSVGRKPTYRGVEHTERIQDWRDRTIGALLHLRDQDYLHQVFDAFRTEAEATDTPSALDAMLDVTKQLGHQWGRLYLVDEVSPNVLVSKQSFGFASPHDRNWFNGGGARLDRSSDSSSEAWWCLDRREPLVFCYLPELANGQIHSTYQGLEAINVNPPRCPDQLQKAPGDYWIDFPLRTGEHAIGKVTLQCDENLLPENFELLKVLAEMVAGLLGAFRRRERVSEQRERWIREATEHSLGVTAHSIATRLASLPILLARYHRLKDKSKPLEALNRQFDLLVKGTLTTIKRTKELLGPVHVKPAQFDLARGVRDTCETTLPEGTFEVNGPRSSCDVEADGHLLGSALVELIQNSRKAVRQSELRIHVEIKLLRRERQAWLRLVYRDEGPGIAQVNKQQIFEPFFTHWPGQKPGLGLGLYFVRRVVEAHGGTIREEGKQGWGVEFVIELPRYASSVTPAEEGDHVSLAAR